MNIKKQIEEIDREIKDHYKNITSLEDNRGRLLRRKSGREVRPGMRVEHRGRRRERYAITPYQPNPSIGVQVWAPNCDTTKFILFEDLVCGNQPISCVTGYNGEKKECEANANS